MKAHLAEHDSARQPHTAVREFTALVVYRDFVLQLVLANIEAQR